MDKVPENADPDRDKCGLIWCTSIIPFTGSHVKIVLDTIRNTMSDFGFELMVTLVFLSDRQLVSLAAIKYDREIENEDKKALECYKILQKKLIGVGYPPYRLGLIGEEFFPSDDSYSEILNKIKNALDPKGVLAPGRYDG